MPCRGKPVAKLHRKFGVTEPRDKMSVSFFCLWQQKLEHLITLFSRPDKPGEQSDLVLYLHTKSAPVWRRIMQHFLLTRAEDVLCNLDHGWDTVACPAPFLVALFSCRMGTTLDPKPTQPKLTLRLSLLDLHFQSGGPALPESRGLAPLPWEFLRGALRACEKAAHAGHGAG